MEEDFTLPVPDSREEREIRKVFYVGVILKALSAFLETILGVLLLYTHVVTNTITFLLNWAVVQDPDNFFLGHLHSFTTLSPSAQFLGGVYLASHGLVKLFLMIALLRGKVWAYPASIAVIGLLMVDEVVRFIQTLSVPTLLLFIFDAIILILIWHEYRLVRAAR